MIGFAAAAEPDAESVFVAWGLGDFVGVLVVFGVLVVLGELVALAELLGVPDSVALGEDVVVCFALPPSLGVALTLRVLPPVLAGADAVVLDDVADALDDVADPDPDVCVVADPDVCVGEVDADGFEVGVGVLPVVGSGTLGKVLGGGGAGGLALVGVGVGVGDLEWVGVDVGDELGWDWGLKSSHCWLSVTTDATRADTAAEALDVPNWSAEATKE